MMIQPILSINAKTFCTLSSSSPWYSLQAQSLNIYQREKKKKKGKYQWIFSLFQCFILGLNICGLPCFRTGTVLTEKKPDPKDIAARAHWLVSQNFLGVLKYARSPSLLSSLLAQKGYSCVVQGCFVELEAYCTF